MNNKDVIDNQLVVDQEVRAWKRNVFDAIEIYIIGKNISNGKKVVALNLEYVEVDSGWDYPSTTMLRFDLAQLLMDDLWNCGLRPSEGTGSAGSLKATQTHLKDMRDLVWKLLPNILRQKNE